MIRTLLIAAITLSGLIAGDRERKIEAVENGLTPPVHIDGRDPVRYNIHARMKEFGIRGLSLAVIDNYKIDWAKGYGILDDESKKPVDIHTLFQAGSISKPVAVTGAMKLVEAGKLSLDEDVNLKLKSWKVPENEFTKDQKVTPRRIMSHSAGLTVHGFPGYAADEPVPSVPDLLDGKGNTAAVRVDLVPGNRFRYSGGGTTVLQLMMSDISGRGFPELMQELVIRPAGMKDSTYEQPLPDRWRKNVASGYKSNGKPVPGRFHTYPEMAAAGLWTTASDLARFAIAVADARRGHSEKLIKRSTAELMLTEQIKPYGLGFSLEGLPDNPRFGHNGVDEGFDAMLTCSFQGRGVAIMVNANRGMKIASEIAYSVAKAYGWPAYAPVVKKMVPLSAGQLDSFAGTFQVVNGPTLEIRREGDHLVVTGPVRAEVYPESDSRFFSLGDFPAMTFSRDAQGNVTELSAGNLRAVRK